LNESYESDGISSVNIESYQQFVSAYQEAFEKGEANSNFMNQNQIKFHLVVRFTLSKGDKKKKQFYSKIDFVDLVNSSLLMNQEELDQNEIKWLNESYGSLFSYLLKSYSNQPDSNTNEPSVLTNFLENNNTVSSQSKLLFICSISPSIEDIQINRVALEYASHLRNFILEKGEKKPPLQTLHSENNNNEVIFSYQSVISKQNKNRFYHQKS